nr:polyprotein [Negevirus sp.]
MDNKNSNYVLLSKISEVINHVDVVNSVKDKVHEIAARDSGVVTTLNSLVNDLVQQTIKSCTRSAAVYIPVNLSESDQSKLSIAYSHFNVIFGDGICEPHGFAHALRLLSYHQILSFAGYSPRNPVPPGYDVLIKDVGCSVRTIVNNGFDKISGCAPVIDVKDSQRFSESFDMYLGNINDTISHKAKTVLDSMSRPEYQLHPLFCTHTAQNCPRKAPILTFVHSIYDMSLEDIADSMQIADAKLAYGVFIFDPKILYNMTTVLPDMGVKITYSYRSIPNRLSFSLSRKNFIISLSKFNMYKNLDVDHSCIIYFPDINLPITRYVIDSLNKYFTYVHILKPSYPDISKREIFVYAGTPKIETIQLANNLDDFIKGNTFGSYQNPIYDKINKYYSALNNEIKRTNFVRVRDLVVSRCSSDLVRSKSVLIPPKCVGGGPSEDYYYGVYMITNFDSTDIPPTAIDYFDNISDDNPSMLLVEYDELRKMSLSVAFDLTCSLYPNWHPIVVAIVPTKRTLRNLIRSDMLKYYLPYFYLWKSLPPFVIIPTDSDVKYTYLCLFDFQRDMAEGYQLEPTYIRRYGDILDIEASLVDDTDDSSSVSSLEDVSNDVASASVPVVSTDDFVDSTHVEVESISQSFAIVAPSLINSTVVSATFRNPFLSRLQNNFLINPFLSFASELYDGASNIFSGYVTDITNIVNYEQNLLRLSNLLKLLFYGTDFQSQCPHCQRPPPDNLHNSYDILICCPKTFIVNRKGVFSGYLYRDSVLYSLQLFKMRSWNSMYNLNYTYVYPTVQSADIEVFSFDDTMDTKLPVITEVSEDQVESDCPKAIEQTPLEKDFSFEEKKYFNEKYHNNAINALEEIKKISEITRQVVEDNLSRAYNTVKQTKLKTVDFRLKPGVTSLLKDWGGKGAASMSVLYRGKYVIDNREKDETYTHCYGPTGLVKMPQALSNETDFFLVYKGTEVYLEDRYIPIFTNIINNYKKEIEPQFKFIQGVPGCGKTQYIIDNYKPGDLVLTATKQTSHQTFLRAQKKYGDNAYANDFRTASSYVVNDSDKQSKYHTVWIDEARMLHAGMVIAIAQISECSVLYCLGDQLQIPYVCRVTMIPKFYDIVTFATDITYLYVSHRVPVDVACHFSADYEKVQNKPMLSSSSVMHSLKAKYITSVEEIPKKKKNVYLTFMQSEKHLLLSKGFKSVHTVHEYQGDQNPDIVVVRLNSIKGIKLYDRGPWVLVALTRHTRTCTYYTMCHGDYITQLMNKSFTKSVLNKYCVNLAGGGVDGYCCDAIMMTPPPYMPITLPNNIVISETLITGLPPTFPLAITNSASGVTANKASQMVMYANYGKIGLPDCCFEKGRAYSVIGKTGRLVFHLITRDRLNSIPYYHVLKLALESLNSLCLSGGITSVHVPFPSFVNDQFDYATVLALFVSVFHDVRIVLHVGNRALIQDGFIAEATLANYGSSTPTEVPVPVLVQKYVAPQYVYRDSDYIRVNFGDSVPSDKNSLELINEFGFCVSDVAVPCYGVFLSTGGQPSERRSQPLTRKFCESLQRAYFSDNDFHYLRVHLMQIFDILMPGCSSVDSSFDVELVHSTDIEFPTDPVRLKTHSLRLGNQKKYDALRPVLNTNQRQKRPRTGLETLLALNKRNFASCSIGQENNTNTLINGICRNFIENVIPAQKRHLIADYQRSPLHCDFNSFSEWLKTQSGDLEKAWKHVGYDKVDWSTYSLDIKTTPKPKLDPSAPYDYTALQTIVASSKELNILLCPMFKQAKERMKMLLPHNIVMFTDISADEFATIFNDVIGVPSQVLYCYENDISKCDKSQSYDHLVLDCRIMSMLGFPKWIVDHWFQSHVITYLSSPYSGIFTHILYQRKSGDPSTWALNTFQIMLLVLYVFPIQDLSFLSCSGDDMILITKKPVRDFTDVFTRFFSFECKSLTGYKYIYYCSKFLYFANGSWHFIPDLLKIIIKLGRADLSNYTHVDLYRISICDLIKNLSDVSAVNILSCALKERYHCSFDINLTLLCHLLVRCARSKNAFRNFWFHLPTDNVDPNTYNTVPDI